MGNSVIQPSFSGGELAPALYGRVDQGRYLIGLKTCRNFIVQQYGGVKNRAGTRYVASAKHADKRARLIPFAFSTEQTYVLEFGHLYMRVFKDGGQVESSPGVPFEIVTPYTEAQLPKLKYTQSADVMTICHPSHAPRQLARTGHASWTLGLFEFKSGPFRDVNINKAATVYASGATGAVTLTASAPIFNASHVGTLFEITQKNYGQPWEPGKTVSAGDIRRADGKYYRATSGGTTGTLRPTHDADIWSDGGVSWEFLHPGFGVARITGVTSGTSAIAEVITRLPDGAVGAGGNTYKWVFGAWGGETGYPACVSYFQERQVFAATPSQPQTVWMSKSGDYTNFGRSMPSADDDAITFTIASREVNAIRHLLPMSKLMLLTSGAEWAVSGADGGVVTPAAVHATLQGYRGASDVPALLIGNSALYVQDKGATVRDIGYEFASDSYTGNDLILFSQHMTERYAITDWAFQKAPFMTAWAVRDDGVLLGMTYLKEQQISGWHRHDTDGKFESVCSVSEGDEDAVYVIVNRNGQRNVERFASRRITSIEDAFFVDSGLSYDGRNNGTTTVTLSGGTSWGTGESLTITASSALFTVADVGDEVHLTDEDGALRLRVMSYTSPTVVTVSPNRTVPVALRNTATDAWALARNVFAGLGHLEGKKVSILADGHVHPDRNVTSGAVTLQSAASVVHVGLPIVSDMETLDLTVPGETVRDKQKLVAAVRVLVEQSRNLWAGMDADHLIEYKQRSSEGYDRPVALMTGLADMRIPVTWNNGGRVLIRQTDPLPLHVLAVIPEITLGGA